MVLLAYLLQCYVIPSFFIFLQTNLYEQVVLELVEVGERDLAKEILRTVDPLVALKEDHPERYTRLEHFCKRPFFNASDVYEVGEGKERVEVGDSMGGIGDR